MSNYILNIETSADHCSICISNDHTPLYSDENQGFSHAEMLAPMIKKAFETSKIKLVSLNAVAISAGPGSYTGLRIGTSLAKGLCYSLNIPLISINTLKIIAYAANKHIPANQSNYTVIPMIDARRDEVYWQGFDQNLIELNSPSNLILQESSFSSELSKACYFTGSGSEKAKNILAENVNTNFIPLIQSKAECMPIFSFEKFKMKDFENLAYFEPFYLKPFISSSKNTI